MHRRRCERLVDDRAVSHIAGREAELETLAAFLERVPSATRALVVRGEPGIVMTFASCARGGERRI
jgi:hypothetical protein